MLGVLPISLLARLDVNEHSKPSAESRQNERCGCLCFVRGLISMWQNGNIGSEAKRNQSISMIGNTKHFIPREVKHIFKSVQ